MNVDISILFESAELSTDALLTIVPLAPLSMVADLPGSFYKTLKAPDKRFLCGLFENLLNWHFSKSDRSEILKQVDKNNKKRKLPQREKVSHRSSYLPLLEPYFEVIGSKLPQESIFYNDLWKRAYRRSDAGKIQAGGAMYLDYRFLREMYSSYEKISDMDKYLTDNIDKIPFFYTTPTGREYIAANGAYEIDLKLDRRLLILLQEAIRTNDLGYLGHSEGWVTISIKEVAL